MLTMRQRMRALRYFAPFLKLLWRVSPWLTLAGVAQRLARALAPVAALYVGKLIIDEVVALAGAAQSAGGVGALLAAGELDRLVLLVAIEMGIGLASDALGRVGTLVDGILGERFTIETSIQLMEHTAALDLERLEDADLQDRIERARRQCAGGTWLLGQLSELVQDAITITGFAIGLMAYEPWLMLIVLAGVAPSFLTEVHFAGQAYALAYGNTHRRREIEYALHTGSSVETAKEVKLFGLVRFLVDRYRSVAEVMYRMNRSFAIRKAAWSGLASGVGTAGYYAAYAILAWGTIAARYSIGDLTFLAGSFSGLRRLADGFLQRIASLGGQALYLDDLFSFFRLRPRVTSPPVPLRVPARLERGIRFENVGFRYPGQERWAVRHLNFELLPGEIVAFVGENGAGKTTIVKLLARLYDPNEGRILLDGRDLRSYDLDDLRANIGVILQDFVRYQLSAGENIGLGRVEAINDRVRIRSAAERSLAHEVIRRLPRQYDQIIGRRFHGGLELSLGEWQKIAIARAYMRDAPILILDEPTASLDARSEYEVFQRFRDLSQGKTVILISHRFSSVRMADRIFVLANGAIEASGTHDELLARCDTYADMFELQAVGYR